MIEKTIELYLHQLFTRDLLVSTYFIKFDGY